MRVVVVVVVVVVAFTVSAATIRADDGPLAVSLAEVLAAAPNAPAAQIPRHEIAASEALVDAAGAWPNPALRVETNRLTARLVTGATFPLPVFGTVGAARREATANAATVRSEAAVDQLALRTRAVTAWIALARADGEIAAAAIAATQAGELERIARERLDAGSGAEVDVTTAHAALARAELGAAAAARAQQASSAELSGVLGWDPTRPLVTTGDLPGREPVALDALRTRLPAHLQRAVAQRKIAAADAALAQVRSQRWPSLAIEAQLSMADAGTPGTDVLFALSLDVPVFARAGDRARSARATASAERARLAATETQLAAGLVAAYRRWQAAFEKVVALETEVVPAQQRAATLSAQAYREGARDLASALQADRDLAAVRAELNAARADLASAWTDLHAAAGDDPGAPRAR